MGLGPITLQFLRDCNDFFAFVGEGTRRGDSKFFAGPAEVIAMRPGDAGYRVTVILRNSAMRSASGGWVLNKPERIWRGENGATMQSAAVVEGISMGIFLL